MKEHMGPADVEQEFFLGDCFDTSALQNGGAH